MNTSNARKAWKQAAILFCVGLLHVLVLAGIGSLRGSDSLPEIEFRSEFFYLEPTVQRVTREQNRSRGMHAVISLSRIDEPNVAEQSTAPLSLPSIDWQLESERAAVDVAARYPTEPLSSPSTGSAADVFRLPLHRQGDSQHLGSGELITWTEGRNGRCYVTNQPSTVARLDERSIVAICKSHDTKSRDDLFDALRPRYLEVPPTDATFRR